jgi:hypothetical protein
MKKKPEIVPAEQQDSYASSHAVSLETESSSPTETESDSESATHSDTHSDTHSQSASTECPLSARSWCHLDLVELYSMYQHGISMHRIAKCCGHSANACKTALKKIMIQQILHTSVEDVQAHYNDDDIPNLLKSKYYVPLDESLSFAPPKRSWSEVPWGIFAFSAFVLIIIGMTPSVDEL